MGPMGAGKTTIGTILARELNRPYIDNDSELSTMFGFSQEQLGSMDVDQLHDLESQYLVNISHHSTPFIAGVAASVIEVESNQKILEDMFSIYLSIPLSVVIERAGSTGVGRQALSDDAEKVLTQRYKRRDPLYRHFARFTVELGTNPEIDARDILKRIGD
jgi:shikimate kinase